ncbi:MAG: DUF2232 domain-containing protein, partial [Smithellaceae bacterium]|nr:DUF2232 domain-containing protein [Smithellaceae bacterium]
PWQLIGTYVAQSVGENINMYAQMGFPAEQVAILKDNARQIIFFLTNVFPALVLVSISSVVLINLLAARGLLAKQGISFPAFGELALWKSPDHLVWLFIAAGMATLVPLTAVRYVGINLLVICMFVYLLQGLAIIGFFFRVKQVPVYLRGLFYLLIFLQQYLMILVVALGLFDLWIDFRRFLTPAQSGPPGNDN